MKWVFRLFVAGKDTTCARAVDNLRRIGEEFLQDRYELEIIDILERPEAAVADRVLAIPTLIKVFPPPRSKTVGDLSDRERVLLSLGLVARLGEE